MSIWEAFTRFKNKGAAAAAAVQPTFDEAMCQRFNQFYDVEPLPQGRVRPVFSEVNPPLELVAFSNYDPPRRSDGSIPLEITPQVQDIFINFFEQFEPFPSGLARCQDSRNTLKGLKASSLSLFEKPLKWYPASSKVKMNLIPLFCKRTFLGHVVEHVTKPVVLEWDKYIKDNQQPLDRYQEEYLSTLLQCTLLEGMDDMLEKIKGDMTYVPTPAEIAHLQQFKQKIEGTKKNVERLREQLELNKSSDEADAEELAKNPTLSPLKRRGGKSKRQRRQRSKRQRRQQRQRSKRQRPQRQKTKKYYK
jgi:hypothetical protein